MYIIKNKPKNGKIIWDAEKEQPLLRFDKGHFETEDAYIAEKAKVLGYEVEEKPDQPGKTEEKPDQPGKTEEKPDQPEKTKEPPKKAVKSKSGSSSQKRTVKQEGS